jgi:ribonuclease-3
LLFQALTHASWVQDRTESYERLEFLGDSVLGLAVASYLYDRFPEEEEGRLAKLKAYVVSRVSCDEVARRIGVDGLFLRAAPGLIEDREELSAGASVLGNVLEALIGGIYVVFGFEAARSTVVEAFMPQVEFALEHNLDHKTALQELLAARSARAEYRLTGEEGPPHKPLFRSEVMVGGRTCGFGYGRSIKASEQEAARCALERLGVGAVDPESVDSEPGGLARHGSEA